MIIPQEAIDRFERRAAEVQALLRRARDRGEPVPSDAYLADFLSRHRGPLLWMIAEALAQRAPILDLERADEWTPAQRTEANLAAMQLLAHKSAATMTTPERKVAARYSGWGGLSLDKAKDGFPPSLGVDPVALIHEYYTPTYLTVEIARAVRSLLDGLAGADVVIRALEPSAGIGRFIRAFDAAGGPPIRWTAIELSALAASLLAAVRPGLEVFTSSFETWVAQHGPEYVGRLNLVVSNPPFGSRGEFKFQDPDRGYREDVAWAYFLRRGLDLLAPGGLGIYIIPMGFMSDPKRKKIRERVLIRHHLVAAFRLPSQIRLADGRLREHFPGAHNVTDLVLFRRRVGELVELDPEDRFVADGRYFEAIPGHVLGEEDRAYRLQIVGPPVRLPPIVERPICQACRIRPPEAPPPQRKSTTAEILDPRLALARALAPRIDAYLAAVSGGRDDAPHLLWPELVSALRAFTAQYGSPLDASNVRVLSRDRDVMRSFLRAFEPDGGLLPSLRERPPQRTAVAPTGDPLLLAEHLYRAERGLTLARLMQRHDGSESRDAILGLLLQAGWCVDGPGLGQLVPESIYFTGDLWARYDRAMAHPDDPQAREQARRLLDVIGPALLTDLGTFSLRESWIPLALVATWISKTLNANYPAVELHRADGLVQVRGLDYQSIDEHPRLSPDTISLLGWLNHDLVIFKPEKQKKMESLNEARARRAEGWDREFRDWIRGAPERTRVLMEAYNRHHRGFVLPTYSEDPLPIARWTRDPSKQLHDYQRAAVRRVLENRGGLLNHDTGLGKTFTSLAILAAARQEGWVRRPVVIVPNNIVLQWRDEIATVLSNYRVVIIGANPTLTDKDGVLDEESETDTPAERAQKWARFQAGEYDLALLTYSSMPRTRIDPGMLAEMFRESPALARQLALKRRNILEKKPENRTEREKAILAGELAGWILERLELPERWDYDGDVRWEDLGVDFLIIDEIHNFKNLFLPEPREQGVPAFMGSAGEGSARAWQLFFRAAIVRKRTGGAGILGLSATPAKNGPIELYSVINYITPRAWLDLGIYDPEQFVDTFCIVEQRPIVTAAMRLEERPAMVGFKRLRDLQSILRRFLDMKSSSEMARLGRLKKPKATSELVTVDLDTRQRQKTAEYVGIYREKIAEGTSGHFHLGMITRMGLVAIHPNLDEGYKFDTALTGGEALPKPDDYSSPKFAAVAERVLAQASCGHIVFVEPLAAQVWLQETLVRAGIPRARIALLNAESAPSAADRRKIAQAFNRGEYTVIIANAVAGEGANLQRRTCAVHNVDIPWDPMTRRQRNGRADRQGNELEALIVYDYVAKRSGDGPRLAKLQGKSHWIEEVMGSRDDIALNPAAQVSLSPIELLAELTEDPQETAALLKQVEDERRKRERARLLRQVAALMRSADARFREAERTADPLEASRLRQEGQRELAALKDVDPAIWPLYEQARTLQTQPVVISAEGVPFWESLRIWSQKGTSSTHHEFGRVENGRIGHRKLGEATWTSIGIDGLTMKITPASYTGGWPEDPQATAAAIAEMIERLSGSGTWEDFGWTLASERFLEHWWPRFGEAIRDALARRSWPGRDELYPALAPDGSLMIVEPKHLQGLQLFPPSRAGWERFLALAEGSKYKLHELRAAGRLWWERVVPAGLKTSRPEADGAAAKSTTTTFTHAATAPSSTTPTTTGSTASTAATSTATVITEKPPSVSSTSLTMSRAAVSTKTATTSNSASTAPTVTATAGRAASASTSSSTSTAGAPTSPTTTAATGKTANVSSSPTPTAAATTPTATDRRGHFYRVGDRFYGDTALIGAFQRAGHPAEHAGMGYFDVVLPKGKIAFNRHADEAILPEQSGRLHWLIPEGEVDLEAALAGLVDAGHAVSGGEFTTWPPREAPPASPPAKEPAPSEYHPKHVGLFWQIGDQRYGDTRLLGALRQAHPVDPSGLDRFEAQVPGGIVVLSPFTDEKRFEGQAGRLFTLTATGDADLQHVLDALVQAGLARSGGAWETMPTSYPPRKEPILAAVEPPPTTSTDKAPTPRIATDQRGIELKIDKSSRAEVESDEDDTCSTCSIAAASGGLQFTIDPKELQGALNLIKRVSDLRDEALSRVQIECRGHVIFRVGSPLQFFELRMQSTRCIVAGDASVETRPLLGAPKTLGKGAMTVRKVAEEPLLRLQSGGRQVDLPTVDYTPVGLQSAPVHVVSLAADVVLDLLRRTTFAISTDKARAHMQVLHLELEGDALMFAAVDGYRLGLASIDAPAAKALDGLQIRGDAAERIETLLAELLALTRPRSRKATHTPPPVQLLVAPPAGDRPKMLVIRTELFTFAAAHVDVAFPPLRKVIPATDTLDGLCVAGARELIEAITAIGRADSHALLEFGDGLQITTHKSEGAALRFAVREAFVSGPARKILVDPHLLGPALQAAAGDDRVHLALAYQGPENEGPLIVTRWLADELPRSRRDALAQIHAEVRGHNLALVMPRRL